jgi:glycine/D-amino acid oxidase-like deaminating enzyme
MAKPAAQEPCFSPLWPRLAAPLPELPPPAPEGHYDCAVLGAGITGCSAALHLAEFGARVSMLEASVPGAGTSGHANGQVMAELTRSPQSIVRLYGERRGEQILAATDAAPGRVWDRIERHAIACSAERTGWIEGSPWRWSERGFGKRVASWQARGAPVGFLDAADMQKRVGSRAYAAGILDRRGGMLNPLAYTRGLAHAAMKAGAAIQAPVEVVELVPGPAHWRIVTDRGSLTATWSLRPTPIRAACRRANAIPC